MDRRFPIYFVMSSERSMDVSQMEVDLKNVKRKNTELTKQADVLRKTIEKEKKKYVSKREKMDKMGQNVFLIRQQVMELRSKLIIAQNTDFMNWEAKMIKNVNGLRTYVQELDGWFHTVTRYQRAKVRYNKGSEMYKSWKKEILDIMQAHWLPVLYSSKGNTLQMLAEDNERYQEWKFNQFTGQRHSHKMAESELTTSIHDVSAQLEKPLSESQKNELIRKRSEMEERLKVLNRSLLDQYKLYEKCIKRSESLDESLLSYQRNEANYYMLEHIIEQNDDVDIQPFNDSEYRDFIKQYKPDVKTDEDEDEEEDDDKE